MHVVELCGVYTVWALSLMHIAHYIVFDRCPECREIEAHCQTLLIALCSVLKHILHIVPYTIGHSTAMNRIHLYI